VPDELDVRRPFTRADGLKGGISAKSLRGPRYRKVLRGVFIDASTPVGRDERIAAALQVVGDDAFASHASAGRLHDCPLPVLPHEHVSVRRARGRRRRDDIVCHVDPDSDVQLVRGLRCASPLDTFGQLASLVGLVDLVVVGDHLVRQKRTTPERLVAFCRGLRGPGAPLARRAASYVRSRVDSPMETRLRLLLVLAGIPEPRINHTIREVDGEPVRRFDLSWPEVRVIVEYDGRHHVERIDQWEADLERREAIDDDGWRIIVVVARGVYRNPGHTVERVFRLLKSRRLAGLPGRPADAWRPHFPGRDGIGGDTKAG
jgi:hypothetical protein